MHEQPYKCLPAMFENQAALTPDEPALLSGDKILSYAELNGRANQLAHYLIGRGIGAEQFVAISVPHSPDMVVALLGVLKAGAAYLPIDQHYPAERVAYMLADAKPRFMLTTTALAARFASYGARLVLLDDRETVHAVSCGSDKNPADADRIGPLRLTNPAYLIYTSGSTGKPKGVIVEHRALAHYLAWTSSAYDGVRGVALLPTSPAFDLTVTGLYTPLVSGGCVHPLPLQRFTDDDMALLRRFPCTFLKVTPSHLKVLMALPADIAPSGELLLGGEALFCEAVEGWRQTHPHTTVINVYGPTEATVNCAEYRIPPGASLAPGPVPIGRPHASTQLLVLDDALRPVGAGDVGQLYIASGGLARGYLNRPGATADKFLPCPSGVPGSRMYRTGDLVRQRGDGNLVFAGRVDDQVKFRGYRIELGEIESALIQHPKVTAAVCVLRGTGSRSSLLAYVAGRSADEVNGAEIRRYARQRLPEYMVPAMVIVRDQLPITVHGKVDRKALEAEVS